ncbi:mCG145858, partial [Mus musculus]
FQPYLHISWRWAKKNIWKNSYESPYLKGPWTCFLEGGVAFIKFLYQTFKSLSYDSQRLYGCVTFQSIKNSTSPYVKYLRCNFLVPYI